jgi:hypothetical protein
LHALFLFRLLCPPLPLLSSLTTAEPAKLSRKAKNLSDAACNSFSVVFDLFLAARNLS